MDKDITQEVSETGSINYDNQIHQLQEEIDILQKKYDVLTTRMIKIRAILDYEF